ncbi:MAG TPA: outer membrane protein assembly factor BamC [Methylophilaceae bacterium]
MRLKLKMINTKSVFIILIALLVAGCDSIPFLDTGGDDYKAAGRGRPLEVPPDLTSIAADDTYQVPGGTTYSSYSQNQETQEVHEEKLLPSVEGVRIERAGSQRWLVVPVPPEKAWPVVRDFWTDLGFAVRVENMQTGVMETDWEDPSSLGKDDNGNYLSKFQGWMDKLEGLNHRQKFRTRLDRGTDDSVTEIYMTHHSITNIPDDGKERVVTRYGVIDNGYKDKELKNQSSDDEDIDLELLRRLMVKFGIAEKQAQTIIANPVQEVRATLTKDAQGNATLTVSDPFDRGWRRVGLALDRIGFLVEDKDRSKGLYFVRYSDLDAEDDTTSEDKKGWLDKLAFWRDDDDKAKPKPAPAPTPKPTSKDSDDGFVDKLKFWKSKDDGKTEASTAQQYRVSVSRGGDKTTITVVNVDGTRNLSPTSNRILNLLYEQLK